MSPPTLFRLDGALVAADLSPAPLILGLRRHLDHDPLVSVLVQIGDRQPDDRQRTYVLLVGCAGCAHERCAVGCRAEALRRTLRAAGGKDATLSLVRKGLAARPYRRGYVLRPTATASVLDGAALHPWPEARLTQGWRSAARGVLTLSATLVLGSAGPDPRTHLAALGWRAWPCPLLPTMGLRAALGRDPLALVARTRWRGDPALLLPLELPIRAVENEEVAR